MGKGVGETAGTWDSSTLCLEVKGTAAGILGTLRFETLSGTATVLDVSLATRRTICSPRRKNVVKILKDLM